MRRRLLLFGAGASNGSPAIVPTSPPLGGGLFRELAATFPRTWGALPATVAKPFEDFEVGMGALHESGSHDVPPLMQQMGIYFSRFRLAPSRTDSYSRLIGALTAAGKMGEVAFSTLNYECLLEIALSGASFEIDYPSMGVSDSATVPIFKPHGSCNFLPQGDETVARRGISYSSIASFDISVGVAQLDDVQRFCEGDTVLYPAMSIYAPGKPVQIARTAIAKIQKSWHDAVAAAVSIAIVGVNPNPRDKHIWDPLAASESKLLFVGNKSAFEAWSEKHRAKRESEYLGPTFHSAVDDLATRL